MKIKQLNLLVVIFLTACNLQPDYQAPKAPIPEQWNTTDLSNLSNKINENKLATKISWRDFFKDPNLQNLIDKALLNNRDLKQAVLNIEVVRAQYGIVQNLLPDIDGTATMSDQKIPVTNPLFGGGGFKLRQYSINIGTTAFEIDVFGRLRNLKEAALEEYFSSAEAAQTVRISLVSEVAHAYITLLANKQQAFLSSRTLISQQKSYDLIKSRFKAGISTKLDLNRAETILQNALVDFTARTRLIEQNLNALQLLAGIKIPEHELQGNFKDLAKSMVQFNAGLPADLLLNRPDIRQAEHLLRAANANIGAARAAFFPRLTLTANRGFGTRELSNLFDSTSEAWLFSPQITMPIFTWGRNKANLQVAELRKDISIVQYEKAIQTAFKEVSDGLVAYETLENETAMQVKLVAATKNAESLAKARYDKGVDNYLTVLDAVRSSYAAEQELINKNLAKLSNMVALYAALGGGQIS